MIPEGFPNSLGFLNISGSEILPLIMQFSFFGVMFFASVSLLISALHLIWYGQSSVRSYISLFVYVVVAVPLFLFAYNILPEVVFRLGL